MKKLISVAIVLILCFSFCACGDKDDIVGTWRTYDLGVNIDSPELPSYLTYTFHKNGTGTGPVGSFERFDSVIFDYTVQEEQNIIILNTDEGAEVILSYTLNGDIMTVEQDGYLRVLEKISDDVIINCY